MKQTAVEWLEDKIQSDMTFMEILGLINQAKEMEKEQFNKVAQNNADLSEALQEFLQKYPGVTSGDLQTFVLGWTAAKLKNTP